MKRLRSKIHLMVFWLVALVPTSFAFPQIAGQLKVPEPSAATASAKTAVVAIFTRTPDGVFHLRGSGYVAKPGVIVSSYDGRRAGKTVFIRSATSEALVTAVPVASPHPSDLDVYEVAGATPDPLSLSKRPVRDGDRLESLSLTPIGDSRLEGTATTPRGGSGIALLARELPTPDQVGGPVLDVDGTVVGVLSLFNGSRGGCLVVPAASIAARLAGTVEPGIPVTQLAMTQDPSEASVSTLPPPPPMPLNAESIPPFGMGTGGGSGTGSGGGVAPGRQSEPPPPNPNVVKKARVLNSPRPAYTEQARVNGTQGNVVLRAMVGSNGRVKSVTVLRGLPDGLNEKAIEAAYRLEFEPARDAADKPLDTTLTISVNFTIRRKGFTGTWFAAGPAGSEGLQFIVWPETGETRRGIAILEQSPGQFIWTAFAGSFRNGAFDLTARFESSRCSYRWSSGDIMAIAEVAEVRTCDGQAVPALRTIRLEQAP